MDDHYVYIVVCEQEGDTEIIGAYDSMENAEALRYDILTEHWYEQDYVQSIGRCPKTSDEIVKAFPYDDFFNVYIEKREVQ